MAIGNGELMHVCFPKHSRMATARMKSGNETDVDGKKRGVSMVKNTTGTKERSPDSLSVPNQNTILINIKWYYFTRYGKRYNETQLIKNKIDLKNRKMTNHPPSPVTVLPNKESLVW